MMRKICIAILTMVISAVHSGVSQTRVPQARKFDEFTTGIGSPVLRFLRNYEEQDVELRTRFTRYAAQLRREGAQPYAITYSPRVLEWEIYNRSIAEMRGGALWEYLTPLGFDYRRITVINGGFREVATTELWIVPPGAQLPRPTPTVRPEDVAYCPFVRVHSLPYIPTPNSPLEFRAIVESNNRNIQPTFIWKVSQGNIVSAQGTNMISVDVPVGSSGEVTARVDVNGYSLECPAETTTSFSKTAFGVTHFKFDEFGKINCEDELARLDGLAIELQNDPTLQVHIVIYGGRFGSRNEAIARAARMRSYLVQDRGLESARIFTIDGGYRSELSGELWLSRRGTNAPVTTPTIDRRYVRFRGQARIVNSPCDYGG